MYYIIENGNRSAEYDTQYGDIVFAPDGLDENDPFEELPS